MRAPEIEERGLLNCGLATHTPNKLRQTTNFMLTNYMDHIIMRLKRIASVNFHPSHKIPDFGFMAKFKFKR